MLRLARRQNATTVRRAQAGQLQRVVERHGALRDPSKKCVSQLPFLIALLEYQVPPTPTKAAAELREEQQRLASV